MKKKQCRLNLFEVTANQQPCSAWQQGCFWCWVSTATAGMLSPGSPLPPDIEGNKRVVCTCEVCPVCRASLWNTAVATRNGNKLMLSYQNKHSFNFTQLSTSQMSRAQNGLMSLHWKLHWQGIWSNESLIYLLDSLWLQVWYIRIIHNIFTKIRLRPTYSHISAWHLRSLWWERTLYTIFNGRMKTHKRA